MEKSEIVGTGRVAPEPSLVPWDGLEGAVGRRGRLPRKGLSVCV